MFTIYLTGLRIVFVKNLCPITHVMALQMNITMLIFLPLLRKCCLNMFKREVHAVMT